MSELHNGLEILMSLLWEIRIGHIADVVGTHFPTLTISANIAAVAVPILKICSSGNCTAGGLVQQTRWTHEMPQVLDSTNEMPQVLDSTHEIPRVLDSTHEMPQVLDSTHEMPQILDSTHEMPQVLDSTHG